MVQAFRFGGVTQPTDKGSSLAYDPKTGTYFPVSYKNEDGNLTASAGPFSFKAERSTENSFTWTPLSAILNVGASFELKVGTELSTNTAGFGITWVPALPGKDAAMLLGAGGALLGVTAAITGLPPMIFGGSKDSSNSATTIGMTISSYLALIATALALVAIQKNMTMEIVLPPVLNVTLYPLLVVKKEEGEEAKFSALESKTDAFKWEANQASTWAALGVARNDGVANGLQGGDLGANAVQNRGSVIANNS